MGTVQDRKAPNAGTKVSQGQDAPVTREGAGFVAPESLAAESYSGGGGFSANRNAQPDKTSPRSETGLSICTAGSGTQSGSAAQKPSSNGSTAPSYVASQLQPNSGGPHGKNLSQEGFDDARLKDGLKMALNSEPGSANDPSRLAEAQFKQGDATQPSAMSHREDTLNTQTVYENLDREVSS